MLEASSAARAKGRPWKRPHDDERVVVQGNGAAPQVRSDTTAVEGAVGTQTNVVVDGMVLVVVVES